MIEKKSLVIISHKKHIVDPNHHHHVFVKGGFLAIKNEFAKHFHKIYLCVPVTFDSRIESSSFYAENIVIQPLPTYKNRKEMLKKSVRICRVLINTIKKADLVYAMGPNDMGIIGMTLARLLRKPLFVSLDTDRAQKLITSEKHFFIKRGKYLFNKYGLYKYIRLLCKNKPAFITGDMFMGESKSWYQWIKSTHQSHDISPYREPTEMSDSPIKITFAGRLTPEKNILTLIKAGELLMKEQPNMTIQIIGEGPLEQELKEYCENKGLTFVKFKGFVSNAELIKTNFLETDIFVLPSKEERQGKVLLEAMCCSIPVIAANAGGIPTVVRPKENGLLFDPYSHEDLASKLKILIEDFELRKQIVFHGYQYAKEHSLDLEIGKIVRKIEAFYY